MSHFRVFIAYHSSQWNTTSTIISSRASICNYLFFLADDFTSLITPSTLYTTNYHSAFHIILHARRIRIKGLKGCKIIRKFATSIGSLQLERTCKALAVLNGHRENAGLSLSSV
jgi:hypothetical protein